MKHKLLAVLAVLLQLTGCASPPSAGYPETQPISTALTEAAPVTLETAGTIPENTWAAAAKEAETAANSVMTEAALEETVSRFTETDAPEQTEPTTETATHTEAKPSETQPTESAQPKPTQPKPTEPAATQPKPTETQPAETQPTGPAPTQPTPTEPTPPPHTHSWGAWQQTKAPTCAEPGEEQRICPGCGAVESRPIAATGIHSWVETAPTCTQDGAKTCSVCNAAETLPALGHDWVHHDEAGHWGMLVTCYCGAQFSSSDEWEIHASASDDLDYLNAHAGYEAHPIRVIDSPAQDICSRCGAVK